MKTEENPLGIDFVSLVGSAEERGIQLAQARSHRIGVWLNDWLENLARSGISNPSAYYREFLASTDFLPAIHTYTPDLFLELEALAIGCGVDLNLLLAAQCMDEEWVYRKASGGIPNNDKCTAFAVRAIDGSTWIGQNMDLESFTDGHQLLIQTEPERGVPSALIATVGGMMALLGVNSRRVAICVNHLPQLPTADSGLPVAFIIRKVLQATSANAAAEFVKSVPHAVGQHYLIADPGCVRSLEASAEGVIELSLRDGRMFHTNHPLFEGATSVAQDAGHENSWTRLHWLKARLSSAAPNLETFQKALSSSDDTAHPICRTLFKDAAQAGGANVIGFTTLSMIMSLSSDRPDIPVWVTKGPPTQAKYEQFKLSTD